jgi:hypothetical protein
MDLQSLQLVLTTACALLAAFAVEELIESQRDLKLIQSKNLIQPAIVAGQHIIMAWLDFFTVALWTIYGTIYLWPAAFELLGHEGRAVSLILALGCFGIRVMHRRRIRWLLLVSQQEHDQREKEDAQRGEVG